MNLLKLADASKVIPILMVDSTTGLGKTGLTVAVTISKNGAAFAAATGVVTELVGGHYFLTPSVADSGTLGSLVLRATATGALDFTTPYRVVAFDPYAATNLGLSALPTVNPGGTNGLFIAGTNAATTVTTSFTTTFTGSLSGSVASVAGAVATVTDKAGYSLATSQTFNNTGSTGSVTGAVGSVTGAVGSVTGSVGSVTAGVIVTTNNDKTGYGLTAGEHIAIGSDVWTTPVSRILTAGTNIVLAKGTGITGLNDLAAVAVENAVWDATRSAHVGTTTFGFVLDVAVSGRMASYAQPAGFLAAAFPASVSSFAGSAVASVTAPVTITGKPAVTLAASDVTGNLPSNLLAIATQTVTATVPVAFPAVVSSFAGGAVASVAGSVGSVTGAVGSVTGSVGSVAGAVASVTGSVTVGTNNDKTGYTASTVTDKGGYTLATAQTFNTTGAVGSVTATVAVGSLAAGSIATATFATGATIPRVTQADTVTTYTGNTPQTGDNFARIGTLGAGLTALAQASQIPANFTSATFASTGVFAAAALANAPTGSGGDTTGTTTLLSRLTAGRATLLDNLSNLDAAVSSRGTSNFAGGAVASVTAGVTVTTNNDKAGYSVSTMTDKAGYSLATSQTFNTTGAVGSVAGGVTVSTNNDKVGYTASTVLDKAGYSLSPSQVFSTSGSIGTVTSGVTVANNLDKGGYSLAPSQSFSTSGSVAAVTTVSTPVTTGTNLDKIGYALAGSGLDAIQVEAGINARQALALTMDAVGSGVITGAETSTITVRNPTNSQTRITATVDADGNRTSILLNPPA
jgi:hypothetical protein